ncbi:MAG: hypothetical protein LKH81_08990 [Acetobacter sp.]|nr:hypothetical protein [Acetobacter sp.]MCI1530332.1 hypothetical protein [Acetobacter sp.]MCI1588017.1 hypothetical protein [Acetobacter sp.]MCI1702499.1 hypothetical protein [Acetobacter sp.]
MSAEETRHGSDEPVYPVGSKAKQQETRKNRVISGEACWLDDVEVAGRTKGIVRTDSHDARR